MCEGHLGYSSQHTLIFLWSNKIMLILFSVEYPVNINNVALTRVRIQ